MRAINPEFEWTCSRFGNTGRLHFEHAGRHAGPEGVPQAALEGRLSNDAYDAEGPDVAGVVHRDLRDAHDAGHSLSSVNHFKEQQTVWYYYLLLQYYSEVRAA